METNKNSANNPEEFKNLPENDLSVSGSTSEEMQAQAGNETEEARQKRRHTEDHHVSRRYKMFSNRSSSNDMPHTNTSF